MNKSAQRVLLEALLDQSLRGFQAAPQRELRRLVDLGETLSQNPVQQAFFDFAQGCLRQQDTPFFDLFRTLTQNVNHQAIKQLGLNVGYESWSRGAQRIQAQEAEQGHHIPWTLVFQSERDIPPQAVGRLGGVLAQGRQLGLHTFFFHISEGGVPAAALLPLADEFSDCAFVLLFAPGQLTPELVPKLAARPNVMAFASALDQAAAARAKQLCERRALYGLWAPYTRGVTAPELEALTRLAWELHAPMVLLAAEGCGREGAEQTAQVVQQLRQQPRQPVFPVELGSDLLFVDRIISGTGQLVQVYPSGRVTANGQSAPLCLDGHTLWAVLSSLPPAP